MDETESTRQQGLVEPTRDLNGLLKYYKDHKIPLRPIGIMGEKKQHLESRIADAGAEIKYFKIPTSDEEWKELGKGTPAIIMQISSQKEATELIAHGSLHESIPVVVIGKNVPKDIADEIKEKFEHYIEQRNMPELRQVLYRALAKQDLIEEIRNIPLPNKLNFTEDFLHSNNNTNIRYMYGNNKLAIPFLETPEEIRTKWESLIKRLYAKPNSTESANPIKNYASVIGALTEINDKEKHLTDTIMHFVFKPFKKLEDIASCIEAFDIGKKSGINIVQCFVPLIEKIDLENKNHKYQQMALDGISYYVVPLEHALSVPTEELFSHFDEWIQACEKRDKESPSLIGLNHVERFKEFIHQVFRAHFHDMRIWQKYDHEKADIRTRGLDLPYEELKKTYAKNEENLAKVISYYVDNLQKMFSPLTYADEFRKIFSPLNIGNTSKIEDALQLYSEKINNPQAIVRNMDRHLNNSGIRTGRVAPELEDILALINVDSKDSIKEKVRETLYHWDISTRAGHCLDDIFRFLNDHHTDLVMERIKEPFDRFELARVHLSDIGVNCNEDELYLMSFYASIRRIQLIEGHYLPNEGERFRRLSEKKSSEKKHFEENRKKLIQNRDHIINLAKEDSLSYFQYLSMQKDDYGKLCKENSYFRYLNERIKSSPKDDYMDRLGKNRGEELSKIPYEDVQKAGNLYHFSLILEKELKKGMSNVSKS